MGSEGKEETLDPENWDELRALGHKMLDEIIDFQRDSVNREYQRPTPQAVEDVCVPLSLKGEGESKVFDVFKRSVKPHSGASLSPRFWGAVARALNA